MQIFRFSLFSSFDKGWEDETMGSKFSEVRYLHTDVDTHDS